MPFGSLAAWHQLLQPLFQQLTIATAVRHCALVLGSYFEDANHSLSSIHGMKSVLRTHGTASLVWYILNCGPLLCPILNSKNCFSYLLRDRKKQQPLEFTEANFQIQQTIFYQACWRRWLY